MILIILSIIMGYVGLNIGGLFGNDVYVYLFGIVGVLSPGLFVLEQMNRKMKNKSKFESSRKANKKNKGNLNK